MRVAKGEFTDSEIIVMLGENGTGKTTFIRMMAGRLEPDDGGECLYFVKKKLFRYVSQKNWSYSTLRIFHCYDS